MKTLRLQLVAAVLLLAACSNGPSGEYTNESGMLVWKFKSGGKLDATMKILGMEQTQEMDYKFEDGKIKIGPAGGPQQVITIDEKGCLDLGMMMGKLCKKTN